jgi:hypothetical protein
MRHKPYHLPQVSAPFQSIIETLDEEGVSYDQLTLNPHLLKPSQGLVFGDNIQTKDVDNMSPIWVSKDLNILDGHHRWANSMANEVPIKLVRINLNQKDAARLLNKMQDIFEYQQQIKMEEVVAQDQLNAENDIDSGVSSNEFLATLEHDTPPTDDDRFLLQDVKEGNKEKLTGYRKNEVNEKSRIGNFFLLEPKEGFEKYEIEFDNLLDTHNLDLNFRNNVSPVEVLCNVWFPHVNFKKLSEKHNIPVESLINRAVTEKAKSLGFDGIKYGKSLVQGLK